MICSPAVVEIRADFYMKMIVPTSIRGVPSFPGKNDNREDKGTLMETAWWGGGWLV